MPPGFSTPTQSSKLGGSGFRNWLLIVVCRKVILVEPALVIMQTTRFEAGPPKAGSEANKLAAWLVLAIPHASLIPASIRFMLISHSPSVSPPLLPASQQLSS